MIPRLLYRLTANLPCRLISLDGAPYLERYLLARLGPLTVYLHRFVAPDGDEEVHDHPWRALSVVLAGGYFEERAALDGEAGLRVRLRRVRWANWITQQALHRIARIEPETWTLFIVGRRRKGWGFMRRVEHEGDVALMYYQPFPSWHMDRWAAMPKGRDARRRMTP